MTLENYVPRKGDRVLVEVVVEEVVADGRRILFDGGIAVGTSSAPAASVVKVIHRIETPEEEIARLKEENAKWQKLAEEFRGKCEKFEPINYSVKVNTSGKLPCGPGATVTFWLANGVSDTGLAENLDWHKTGSIVDIVAYRVHPE